jgi:hypothetical protein
MTRTNAANPATVLQLMDAEIGSSLAQVVATVHGQSVTRSQLRDAFDRVSPRNWKEPIDATITLDGDRDLAMVREAVIFFTGSVPSFTAVASNVRPPKCRYRVKAAGYYATCGA